MPTVSEMYADLAQADAAGDAELAQHIAGKIRDAEGSTTGKDIAKTLPWSIPKLAAGTLGMVGSMRELADAGRAKLAEGLPEWARSSDRFLRAINPVNILPAISPSAGDIRKSVEESTGVPWYDPQTRAGKAVDTGVQTAAMMGRNWITNPAGAFKVAGGITGGTELAGAMTNDHPAARFLGGLLGGGVPALADVVRTRPGVLVREHLGPVTPQQIDEAMQMQQAGREVGVPLMGTESFDRGHALASATLAHPSGNMAMEGFLRQRPAQVGAAANAGLLGVTGQRGTPSANVARAEKAATDAIAAAEAQRTAAVSPLYRAAEGETIPPQALRPVSNEIQRLIYENPQNAPTDKTLGGWYNQLFPTAEPPSAVAAGKGGSARAINRSVEPIKDDIVTAIRKLGGINPGDERIGSLADAMKFSPSPVGSVWRRQQFGGAANRSNTVAGHSLDEMTRKLYELGYVESPNRLDDVLSKLEDASLGVKTHYSTFYEPPSSDPLVNALTQLTEQLGVKNAARAPKAAAVEAGVVPETNVGRLNALYKNLGIERDIADIGATAADKLAAYPAGKVQDVLGDVLKRENPNIRKAQAMYADITRTQIDPLRAGPVGVVAGKTGFNPAEPSPVPRVLSTVADANVARPETIRTLYRQLNAQDKAAFPGIVQTHLENKLDAALGDLRGGPNPTAGAKFRDAIVGTPQEQANFNEMMRGVAIATGKNPDAVVVGANKLLRVLDRTGRTPGIGSPTATRGEISREMGKTVLGDTMSTLSLTPLRPLGRRFDDWITRRRYSDLARALTAPDSVEQLVRLAKLEPSGLPAAYIAASMLGLSETTASGQEAQRR